MKFIAPEFLYALGFLAIPILIHLFNFRKYKTIKFSQVKFLKEVKQQTQSTSRLKHLLVLLSRCLAIIALVLAFAQPYFPNENIIVEKGKKGISIYIDNSFSMQLKNEQGELLQQAKNKALAIANSFKETDKFQLLTNEFKAEHQRWLNRTSFIEAIQTVEISPISRRLTEVLSRQNNLFNESELNHERFILSDLQKTTFNINEVQDTSIIRLIAIQAEKAKNYALNKLSFSKPYHLANQREELAFHIKGYHAVEGQEIPLQLYLNDKLKSPSRIVLNDTDSARSTLNYISSSDKLQLGKLAIKDFPLTFDDTLYFNYEVKQGFNVLHLYDKEANQSIQTLFKQDSSVNYSIQASTQLDFSVFPKTDLVILDEFTELTSGLEQEIKKFLDQNGSLLIIPTEKMKLEKWNIFLIDLGADRYGNLIEQASDIATINQSAAIYKDVFDEPLKDINFPSIKSYRPIISTTSKNREDLMTLKNGYPFLRAYNLSMGKCYLFSTSLSQAATNFGQHAIFVPTLYNLGLLAAQQDAIYHELSERPIILSNIKQIETPVHLIGNGVDLIPEQKFVANKMQIKLGNTIVKAGHYQLKRKGKVLATLSLNYDRIEGNISSYSLEVLKEKIKSTNLNIEFIEGSTDQLSANLSTIASSNGVWKYFIALCLLFLAVEIFLLRFLK